MIIRIKNLRLRTIVGINDWEREEKQEVIINIEIRFDGQKVSQTDNLDDSINYRTLNKKIIALVETSDFYTLEKLASSILKLVVMKDKKVLKATIEVDKPYALRFTDSVSIVCETNQ